MKKVDKDNVIVTISGKEYDVFFSFGIDTELAKIFTDQVIEGGSTESDLFTDTVSKVVAAFSEEGNPDEIKADDVTKALKEAFENSTKNTAKMAGVIQQQLTSYAETFSKVCSALLTKRDEMGKIIEPVLASEILYGKVYQTKEARKELEELFNFAQERFVAYIEENVSPKN